MVGLRSVVFYGLALVCVGGCGRGSGGSGGHGGTAPCPGGGGVSGTGGVAMGGAGGLGGSLGGMAGGMAASGGMAMGGASGGPAATGNLQWAEAIAECPTCTASALRLAEDVAVVPDESNDFVAVGSFAEMALIGGTQTLTSAGNEDAFIARFHGDGALVWVRREGGTTRDTGHRVIGLPDGSVIVSGTTSGNPVFGAGEPHETTFTGDPTASTMDNCLYLARLDAEGNLMWVEQACSTETATTRVDGLSLAADGTFYAAGSFGGQIVLGPSTASPVTLTAASSPPFTSFLAHFQASGAPVWGQALQNVGFTDASAMASGGVAVTFAVNDGPSIQLGSGAATPVPAGGQTGLARFDASGALQWASFIVASGGGGDRVTATNVAAALTPGQGVTVAGVLQDGQATFAPGTAQATTITVAPTGNATGAFDPFIARYGDDGQLVWVRRQGGPAQEEPSGLAATSDGGVVLTGLFGVLGSTPGATPPTLSVFGPGEARQTTLTQIGQVDGFVARFGAGGSLLWAKREGGVQAGAPGLLTPAAVAVYPDGSSVNVGNASGQVVFGEAEPGQKTIDLGLFGAAYAARLAP